MPRTATLQEAIYADHAAKLAKRETNRLTDDDRAAIRAGIVAGMRERHHAERYAYAPGVPCVCGQAAGHAPSIADDFNALQRVAWRSIGCGPFDLRESETFEIADMVCAAILDAGR